MCKNNFALISPIAILLQNFTLPAIGMGLEFLMTCDMCIGTNRCFFSLPELKHGLSCTVGSLMVEHLYGRIINTKFIYDCETLDAKSFWI